MSRARVAQERGSSVEDLGEVTVFFLEHQLELETSP